MDLIPEKIDGAVVFNVLCSCTYNASDCPTCGDFAVGLHNWLMTTELKYVVLDFQDEKEVCPAFLEELLQLAKRLKYPFLFSGVMPKPRKVLDAYNYVTKFPIFVTPEEAVEALRGKHPALVQHTFEGIQFGTAIPISRPRFGSRVEGEGGEEEPQEVED
jgi:hypothetical protein